MRRLITFITAFCLCVTSFGVLATTVKKASYLFVMRSATATLSKTANGYELTLQQVDPKTLLFSDRPVRKAGIIDTTHFMSAWLKKNSSFNRIPPNAALVFENMTLNKHKIARAIAVELKEPVAIGKQGWRFQIKNLDGKLALGQYRLVSVFIDCLLMGDAGFAIDAEIDNLSF